MSMRIEHNLLYDPPASGFRFPFSTMPRAHLEFHAIAAFAVIAAAIHLFGAVGCADADVVGRASDIIRQKSDGAANVTLLLIRKLSRSPTQLTCAAFARFQYDGKENTHRDVEYQVAISPDRKEVSASILAPPD